MTGDWKSAGEKPQIAEGTEMAVRMRGSKYGVSLVEEIDGFYLNNYGLWFEDGCECFAEGENEPERERHDSDGCPHTGFFYVDGEEATYVHFRCAEWCKR